MTVYYYFKHEDRFGGDRPSVAISTNLEHLKKFRNKLQSQEVNVGSIVKSDGELISIGGVNNTVYIGEVSKA